MRELGFISNFCIHFNYLFLFKSFFKYFTRFLSKFYNLTKTFSNNNLSQLDNSNNELYENDLTCDVGTFRFMAPEIKKNLDYNNKADIYSCGIVLYEMFENKRFTDTSQIKWYKTPKYIKNIIINYMLVDNPENRYDALSILRILNNNKN